MKNIWDDERIVDVLSEGGVVIMPSDTIYGISGQALNFLTIERINNIKRREEEKPFIVLIGEREDLKKFAIEITKEQKEVLDKYWPGPVSIVLDCPGENFQYLHSGINTLAFRLPAQTELQNLLKKVGPLVSTSANLPGLLPAKNISEAKNYFADLVDLYVDGGDISGNPSKIIQLHKDGSETILRG